MEDEPAVEKGANRSTRKMVEEKLLKYYENRKALASRISTYSRRPYTHVVIYHFIHSSANLSIVNTNLIAHGFAKISGSDVWDPSLGEDIAFKRAIRDLSHQICDLGYAESILL